MAVNIGPGQANHVQIDGMLRAGDRVIIRGGERLEPGQTVKCGQPSWRRLEEAMRRPRAVPPRRSRGASIVRWLRRPWRAAGARRAARLHPGWAERFLP